MKHHRLAVSVALFLNLAVGGVATAVPLQEFVQGYLVDKAGNPLTGPQNMEFKVYQGGSAGQAGSGVMTYDETATVTPAQSGVFSYLLGSGNRTTPALSTATFDAANAPVYVEMSAGGVVLLPRFLLTSAPYAAIAGEAESLKPTSDINTQTLEASSATIQNLSVGGGGGAAFVTITGSAASPSIIASTSVVIQSGQLSAPVVVAGKYYGDGSSLMGVNAGSVSPGNIAAGVLSSGVQVPAASLVNGPIASNMLPANAATTNASNTFQSAQSFPGGITGSTAAFTGAVSAQSFTGTFKGDGSQLTGVSASGVNAANVSPGALPAGVQLAATGITPGTLAAGVQLPAVNLTSGTVPAGVLLPTQQLIGAPINPSLLVSTLAYTTNANTWQGAQTIQNTLTLAPAAGAFERVGGIYSGPTSGYSGVGQETSRHQIVFPSWSNVVNDTLGIKLMGINKTAYPSTPWYLGQNSELHIALLTHTALTNDDTQDLFQFTSSGLSVQGVLSANTATITSAIAAASATFSGSVTAQSFNGQFKGDGSQLTGVSASGVNAANVNPGTLSQGVLLPTEQLTGAPIGPSLLVSTLAYTTNANSFTPTQTFNGGVAGTTATFSGAVNAPVFNGQFKGDGSQLTGVSASAVAAANVAPGTLAPGVTVPPANLSQGTLPGGVLLPTQQLTGAPISPSLLVSTLVYTTNANTFSPLQTFSGGVAGTTATFSGSVNAPVFNGQFKGDGSQITGVSASAVAATNVTPGTFPAGVVLPASNLGAGSLPSGVTVPTSQLSGAPIGPSLLVATVAYTNAPNTFAPTQTFNAGIAGTTATFSGAVNAPVFNGAFKGDGSQITGVTATGVSAANVGAGTLGVGVLLPTQQLSGSPISPSLLVSTLVYTTNANAFGPLQTFNGGVTGTTATFSVFNGQFKGDGSQLTGVSASAVAATNVTPGTLPAGVSLPAGNVAAGTLGSGVLVPTSQLTGPAISPSLLVSTLAYTSNANTWQGPQTIQNTLTLSPSAGAFERVGGIYPGPTSGYSGTGQETSRHQIVFPSWSNVANDTLGVKLMGINKTSYPTTPWYLGQNSEFHIALLTHSAVTNDDTTDLFQFTPSGLSIQGALAANSATFTGQVAAQSFTGAFKGDGSQLTGVSASNVNAASVTAGTFSAGVILPPANLGPGTVPAGVILPTQQLSGAPISPSLLVSTLAYTTTANTFAPTQTFSGGVAGTTATFSGQVAAQTFTGAHKGDGSQLTGVSASAVAAANVTPGTFTAGVVLPATQLGSGAIPANVQVPAGNLTAGILAPGVVLPTQQLSGAPISPSLLVSTLAYTTNANTWQGAQTIQNTLTLSPSAGAVARVGGIYSGPTSGYSGLGQETSRHQIVFPSWSNVANDTLGVKLMAINKTAYPTTPWYLGQNSELHISLLTHSALTNDDTTDLFQFTPSGLSIAGGLTANAATFTYGIAAASATFSGTVTANAFQGSGVGLTGVTASNVAATGIQPGTLAPGVLLPTGQLTGAPISPSLLVSTLAYTTNANTFTPTQTFSGGVAGTTATFSGPVNAQVFNGSFKGDGSQLTGVSASAVAAASVTPGTLPAGVVLPASGLGAGSLPSGVTVPTSQLSGAPIGPSLLVATVAFTNAPNTFAPTQTFNAGIAGTTATFSGAVNAQSFTGTHIGNGAGLTGVVASSVAAANVGAGLFQPGVQIPAAGIAAGVLAPGVLVPTTQLAGAPIGPSLLVATVAYTSAANTFGPTQVFANGVTGSTAAFTGTVTAQTFTGAHVGSAAGLTGIPTSQLTGGPIAQNLLPLTMYLGNALKSNPLLKPDSAAPLTKVDFSADILSVQGVSLSNVSVAASISANGVNGIDAGTLAAGSFYAVFVICNDSGTQVASLLSLTSVPMLLPSGYTHYRRVGWININGNGNIVQFTSIGDWIYYTDATQFTYSTNNGAVSLVSAVPPTSRLISWAETGASYYGGSVAFTPTGSSMPPTMVGGSWTNEDGALSTSSSGVMILNSSQQVNLSSTYSARTIIVMGYYDPI